jgi:NADPH-dependent glutamate synthase beta subunit-like oxidoreductase
MDWEREHIPDPEPAPAKHDYVEKIAVIGSGPAGLTCAFDLAQEGYQVTVFEKHDKLGGMLAVGLPDYRCPPDIVARDLDYIRKTGVDFQTGVELGVDFKLADLLSDKPEFGFGAVFMALGAHRGLQLRVPGEDAEDVILGIDYLREINLGRAQPTGKKVAVIGGGNTAMDVARTARRPRGGRRGHRRRRAVRLPGLTARSNRRGRQGHRAQMHEQRAGRTR